MLHVLGDSVAAIAVAAGRGGAERVGEYAGSFDQHQNQTRELP